MNLLLDTCAVVFVAQSPARLSAKTRGLVRDKDNVIFVSAATIGELACLVERKRITLPLHWKTWLRQRAESQGWNLLPMTAEIIEEAWSLPDPIHRDPVDRVMIATARLQQLTVVTTDRLILDYPHVKAMA
jgi:PIN domain nuclease of toxin-antitoxin system